MNPYKDVTDENSFSAPSRISYEDIATKLLKDHHFLTALELHTELVESGKELPQLREFFSNPGNFEQHVSRASEFGSMQRTPSQATLDSLDTARYSEDGGGDHAGSGGDVAVLEFELRKARETINSLRANLTQFAGGETALDKNSKQDYTQRSIKPHEKRALNFLINEYLLVHDYKLTSITFSDENPDQEFEDWDDVGLNMSRPAGLASLFWGNTASLNVPKADSSTETEVDLLHTECQTDSQDNICVSCQTSIDSDWNHEILIQAEEIELLKQKVIALETEKLNFQKLYDAAIVSLNSLTSPTYESKELDLTIPENRIPNQMKDTPITFMATENHYGSGNSTHSATPDQFEIIGSEKNSEQLRKEDITTSSLERTLGSFGRESPVRRASVSTLDETLSSNDAGEWTRVHYHCGVERGKQLWLDSGLPNNLKVSILNLCSSSLNLSEPLANDLLSELLVSDKPITLTGLLTLVADTLPRLLPHTLVARRCESAALLASTAALLPAGDTRRPKTLHTLLTLVKKPEPNDTRAICEAACLVVKWGGSGEVLSSIAELLASRSSERRILASQICVAIAPYIPIELCTSLLLSLVTLMCESSEPEVRNLGLKSACLICPVAEHKYGQMENLMLNFLKDPIEKIVRDTVNVYVPVLARSSLIAGKFSSELLPKIITNLVKCNTDNDWKGVVLYLDILRVLVVAKLAYVVNVQIVKEVTLNDCDMELLNVEIPLDEQEVCIDLPCYVEGGDTKVLLVAFSSLLKEKPDVRWTELSWFVNLIKQILAMASSSKALKYPAVYESLISLFSSYVDNFSAGFSCNVINTVFMEIIGDLEQKLEKLHAVNVDSMVVVGVYTVTILNCLEEEHQGEFLQKWVVYSSIRVLPVKIFSIPLKWVAKYKSASLNFYLQHLNQIISSSGDSASGVSVRVYVSTLITELVAVADVQEDCVRSHLLPIVTRLLNDGDLSVRESAITAWGGVTRTCMVHRWDSEAQCWASVGNMEDLISTSKMAAQAAEALALLLLPDADTQVNEKAVSLLCSICHIGQLSSECVSALTPGLQLVAHHCRNHPALLPALRKLEEQVQSPSLSQHKPAIELILHNVTGGSEATPPRPAGNLHAAQEVGRRVTRVFQQSNLHTIFKKKT